MKRNLIVLGLGGLLLLIGFQNCSKNGIAVQDQMAGPLVADVVDGMNTQQPPVSSDPDVVRDNTQQTQTPPQQTGDSESGDSQVVDSQTPQDSQIPQTGSSGGATPQPAPSDSHQGGGSQQQQHPPVGGAVEEAVLDAYACGKAKDKKVQICHFPPGNPAAKKTLCIGRSALDAHVNHGHVEEEFQDYLGPCL